MVVPFLSWRCPINYSWVGQLVQVNSGYPGFTSWMLSEPYHLLLKNDHLSGPVNVTAPSPLRMRDFGKTIGSVLNRPHWFPAPSFAMKWVLGQKSKLVLEGQKVVPKVLMEEGFEFLFPKLDLALEDLLKKVDRE